MCLIIHRPLGVEIPETILSNGLRGNPDGWGIVRPMRGKLHIVRGMTEDSFWRAYGTHGTEESFIHFRYATHGTRNLANTHPFTIAKRYAVLHNGIISTPITDKSRSDTWHFVENVVGPILEKTPETFGSQALSDDLSAMIRTDKLVIVRSDGASMIINRHHGVDHEGLWLSNNYSCAGRYDPFGNQDDWSRLDDLSGLDQNEISALCEYDPDFVAGLIRDYFDDPYMRPRAAKGKLDFWTERNRETF